MDHRDEGLSGRNGEAGRRNGAERNGLGRNEDAEMGSDPTANSQRSSFYERAARRMGLRADEPRDRQGARRDQPAGGRPDDRQRGFVEGYRYNEGYAPAGGFGQGGYGSYGGQAQGGQAGNWGNEHTTWRGRPEHREWFDEGAAAPAGSPGRNARDVNVHAPRDDQSERERTGRGRWQREAMTAGEIMTSNVRFVAPETTLDEVARIMRDENCGVVPVIDARRRLVGMVTDRDLVVRAAADGRAFNTTRVSEIMTDEIDAVTADEPIKDVIDLMGKKQVRRVPVVDRDDQLIGIIAMADIANRADYDEDLQDALERVSSRRSFWSRFF